MWHENVFLANKQCCLFLELTLVELSTLYTAARNYCGKSASTLCNWVYPNKPVAYYHDVFLNHGGVMEVYAKDNSGDPGSPINGQIDGLFFMANNISGKPPPTSQFGSQRFQVRAEVLLDSTPNVYFADFFCMRGTGHYVTLVATCPGSKADEFCLRRLLPIDLYNSESNPFLFWDNGYLYVTCRSNLSVEILYTENIDLHEWMTYAGAIMVNVISVCKGSSTPGGIPKNPNCTLCNL